LDWQAGGFAYLFVVAAVVDSDFSWF